MRSERVIKRAYRDVYGMSSGHVSAIETLQLYGKTLVDLKHRGRLFFREKKQCSLLISDCCFLGSSVGSG